MVQLATSSTRQEELPQQFQETGEITELVSGKYFKYVTGKYQTYSEAAEKRKELQSEFPDAFVIAVRNLKIMPLQEAIEQSERK